MKNIKVKHLDDTNSVKVRFEHTAKMTESVDKLLKLSDYDFRQAIRVSKKYRKANKAMSKYADEETLKVRIDSKTKEADIVNDLMSLGETEYRKAIRCAKQYRRANKLLDSAISKYVGLKKEDEEMVRSREWSLLYE
jgi:hypothetical protein